ncbi:MAG: YicC family protein [Proteobacteria bacterium]|nr:YicC family protein [Pseudomonadota bacterium]
MTGYATADFTVGDDTYAIEVKSLNHRYLDMKVRSPEKFYWAEERIREVVKENLSRGSLAIFIKQLSNAQPELTLNIPYVDACRSAANELKGLGIDGELDISFLLTQRDTFKEVASERDVEGDWAAFRPGLVEAINALIEWRAREGEKLSADVTLKLAEITESVKLIEERTPELNAEYREKLTARIKELVGREVDEGRLLTEAAVVAERSSIDEEVIRLTSHVESFTEFLSATEPVGRKLDFLCQEMLREVNTIGSKISDLDITSKVVDIKAVLENIREQVQNIE